MGTFNFNKNLKYYQKITSINKSISYILICYDFYKFTYVLMPSVYKIDYLNCFDFSCKGKKSFSDGNLVKNCAMAKQFNEIKSQYSIKQLQDGWAISMELHDLPEEYFSLYLDESTGMYDISQYAYF